MQRSSSRKKGGGGRPSAHRSSCSVKCSTTRGRRLYAVAIHEMTTCLINLSQMELSHGIKCNRSLPILNIIARRCPLPPATAGDRDQKHNRGPASPKASLADTDHRSSKLCEISRSIANCRDCHLSATRKNAVPGEGSPSWIFFVGEAPGFREDQEGRPFVGPAGLFLDELLSTAGIRRDSVFITNVLKCRPPHNRMPSAEEISSCRPHLDAQLAAVEPRLICTLGAVALRSLLGPGSITRLRGKPTIRNGRVYFPTLHPAASLYDPKLKDVLREDFRSLGQLVQRGPDDLEPYLARSRGLRTLDSFS